MGQDFGSIPTRSSTLYIHPHLLIHPHTTFFPSCPSPSICVWSLLHIVELYWQHALQLTSVIMSSFFLQQDQNMVALLSTTYLAAT